MLGSFSSCGVPAPYHRNEARQTGHTCREKSDDARFQRHPNPVVLTRSETHPPATRGYARPYADPVHEESQLCLDTCWGKHEGGRAHIVGRYGLWLPRIAAYLAGLTCPQYTTSRGILARNDLP